METNPGYLERLAALEARVGQARLSSDVVCERAAGLLAGRIGCRIDEAHTHLRLLAGRESRNVSDVAAGVIAALETRHFTSSRQLQRSAEEALRRVPSLARRHPPLPGSSGQHWIGVVQQMLNALPGDHVAVVPVRDHDGRLLDFQYVAAGPGVRDPSGRTGAQLIGHRAGETYPELVGSTVWRAWVRGEATGAFPYEYRSGRTVTVRVEPVGPGLLTSWVRPGQESLLAERLAQTERLGSLGWGEWDLVTDRTVWSEEMYRIYERDPADGPLPREESDALGLPEDEPLRRQAAEAFGRGETVDVTIRTRINGKIKHLRAVIDTVRDPDGRPLRIYGIIQDVTARETGRLKLADVERQLREHQESLAAEHRLAGQLQHIVLPIPRAPIDLRGLRAAVRYLPAEQASRVGGDWYHAAPAGDGSIILAVGDVAGHGVQAAATMAQLRHALAALTVTTTSDPAELLTFLNRLLYATDPDAETATAVLARYEPATATLVWALAGHPAPLRGRAGTATELPSPIGPLLGALRDARYRTATATLELGDILLLYTDGLIESRTHTLDQGRAPVFALLRRLTAQPAEHPLEDLLARLDRANPDDDTCILAARRLRPGEAASP